jgi:hypothetical protein
LLSSSLIIFSSFFSSKLLSSSSFFSSSIFIFSSFFSSILILFSLLFPDFKFSICSSNSLILESLLLFSFSNFATLSFELYIFNSKSFVFFFNLSNSDLYLFSNSSSFCFISIGVLSSNSFFNLAISFDFDKFCSFNFLISKSFVNCNFFKSSN